MNAVLLKYLRIVIPIGRDEIEAAMFKEVSTRASESQFVDEEHQCSNKPPFAVVNTYVAIQGRSTLLELKEQLLAKKNGVPFKRKSVVGYPWKTSDEEDEENGWQKECYWSEDEKENDPA
ncbi:uncharacterized protein PAC_12942 [Phialocephala subalpina]|uniref:Uncharacterized protein n=1 Tax=Phialocephala subalpina TaxID=576137 RepID=A0A1L7XDD4_9HELO|nr:uncharacterized protein PAC_12942 [Phialocephala subalpina]